MIMIGSSKHFIVLFSAIIIAVEVGGTFHK